jgi:hypothetical protein
MDNRTESQNKKLVSLLFICLFVSVGVISVAHGEDRIKLDDTSIKGSRELPKVLYIVPWKSARLGALSVGAGSESFNTEMKALDRDVFRRQVQYYGMLYGESVGVK